MNARDSLSATQRLATDAVTTGTEVLLEAARRQRSRVLSVAAAIRLTGAVFLLIISFIVWRTSDGDDWTPQIPTLIAYGTLALVSFMAQGRSVMIRLAWVQPLLDIGFAYAVLRTSILLEAAGPQSMAGLSVAVFLLPVALTGLAFRTRTLIMVTTVAALANLSLMDQAGLGHWPMITATAVLLLAASGSKLARETIAAEITRRLLAEASARYEKLSQLQRDKDSLLGIIVHDMRSPVSSTLLSLEFLQAEMRRHVVARPWQEAITDALASCSNLSEMIAQILDTTRLETGRKTLQLSVVDVAAMLEQAREHTLTHARSKSLSIELDAPVPLPVAVDSRLFLRVLESLITCSIRQTPTGGRILLQAARDREQIRIGVHRSGTPIPADQRDLVFEKFQPGEPSGLRLAGWGLGLYFCRLTAEAHKARLSVEDVEGWPCTYEIRLDPLPTALAAVPVEEPRHRHPTPTALPIATAGALLKPRSTPASPRTRAALAQFARTLAPLEGELNRTTQVRA